ncbi:MAG: YciI family protein [Gemmatimonadota bacterium]
MRYSLLIANAPDAWDPVPGSPDDRVISDWDAYTAALAAAGVLVTGAGLRGADAATSVRLRGGKRLVTDGPFADTKEHLIGFYIIEVASLDEALDWAARMPNIRNGAVEVRPIWPVRMAHESAGMQLVLAPESPAR